MNRLRDGFDDEPLSERGLELLRGTPPAPALPEMKRRVWSALQQSQMRAASNAFGAPGLRVFAMAATILALAGTAGAVITDRVIVPILDRAAGVSEETRRGTSSRAQRPRPARAIPISVDAKPTLAPPAAEAPAVTKARRARPAVTTAPARTPVHDALVALRRDHDPVRAGELLSRYLTQPGRGALREEALVLAIEAADARGDHVQARRFARTYLTEFPRGRFGEFARTHEQGGEGP